MSFDVPGIPLCGGVTDEQGEGEGQGRRDGCHKQSHARIQGVDRVGRYGHGCWWPRREHYGEEEVDANSDLLGMSKAVNAEEITQ